MGRVQSTGAAATPRAISRASAVQAVGHSEPLIMRLADVETVLIALATRPFLIISGLSGTGKTQLVRRLAESFSERGVEWTRQALADCRSTGQGGPLKYGHLFQRLPAHPQHVAVADLLEIRTHHERPLHERRTAFQPVRPDWDDAKKIWGYYNPLTGRFHPTDALVVLLNAYRSYLLDPVNAPLHFLVLDEMNLARVEYYLSDVLSLMEAGCRLDPHDPLVVHLGELARVHPLESCITSLGTRGVAAPPPPLFPAPAPVPDPFLTNPSTARFAAIGGGNPPPVALPASTGPGRPSSDDQLVPLWELEEDQWFYEPLVKASKVVWRQPAAAMSEPPPGASRRKTPLQQIFPIPPRVAFPPNLVVVGTVNVDETSHGFAPKVLDRAFVVELTQVDWDAAFEHDPRYQRIRPLLQQVFAILEPWDLQIGYRVVGEMLDYLQLAGDRPAREVEDDLLRAKVLTRVAGSEERLVTPLRELLLLCLVGPGRWGELGEEERASAFPALGAICQARQLEALLPPGQPAWYPESARKLLSMARRLLETGFTSFF